MHLGFQFHFTPKRTTPYRLIGKVADRMLNEILIPNGFDSFMPNRGAIDGWIGVIYREDSSVSPEEHSAFIDWIQNLPIDAVAHIGDLEDADRLDTRRAITERIIQVEGCSSADREESRLEKERFQPEDRATRTTGDEQDGDDQSPTRCGIDV